MNAEEEAAKLARKNAIVALNEKRDSLEKESIAANAKVEASKAEVERLSVEYNDAKKLSEEANPQTKEKVESKEDQGERRRNRRRLQEGNQAKKVDPANAKVVEENKEKKDDHSTGEGQAEVDHGVAEDHASTENVAVQNQGDPHGEETDARHADDHSSHAVNDDRSNVLADDSAETSEVHTAESHDNEAVHSVDDHAAENHDSHNAE